MSTGLAETPSSTVLGKGFHEQPQEEVEEPQNLLAGLNTLADAAQQIDGTFEPVNLDLEDLLSPQNDLDLAVFVRGMLDPEISEGVDAVRFVWGVDNIGPGNGSTNVNGNRRANSQANINPQAIPVQITSASTTATPEARVYPEPLYIIPYIPNTSTNNTSPTSPTSSANSTNPSTPTSPTHSMRKNLDPTPQTHLDAEYRKGFHAGTLHTVKLHQRFDVGRIALQRLIGALEGGWNPDGEVFPTFDDDEEESDGVGDIAPVQDPEMATATTATRIRMDDARENDAREDQARQDYNNLAMRYTTLQISHTQLQHQYEDLARQHRELHDTHTKLHTAHTELGGVYTGLSAAYTKLHATYSQLSGAHAELGVAHAELRGVHEELRAAHAWTVGVNEELRGGCEKLQGML